MKKLLFSTALCLGLSACGGGGGGGGNESTSALNAGRFFDESWIEPGNGWWMRLPKARWAFVADSWGDYIIYRATSHSPSNKISVGDTFTCDISGNMSVLDAEHTDSENYYYRIHFQQCVMDATINSSSSAPPFDPPTPIEITANGIVSQRKQRLSVAEGTQDKTENGFEELHLTIPSLSPEKSEDSYIVSTPSPFEFNRTERVDERVQFLSRGSMNITRGDEVISYTIQNDSAEIDLDYLDCGTSNYATDEFSMNSNQTGLLRYSYSEQVPAGEATDDDCIEPGIDYKSGNTPLTLHNDRFSTRYGLMRDIEEISSSSDSDSLFNFTHSDGSRMRITSTANPPETTVEVDKDGDGSFEIRKTFSDVEYLSTMQLLRDVKRRVKEE